MQINLLLKPEIEAISWLVVVLQALMDEILMLQDEISALQACFSQELQLDEDSLEADAGDQLALQSTLTVLGERMATIHMKASGKRQLLEVRRNNIMQSNGDKPADL